MAERTRAPKVNPFRRLLLKLSRQLTVDEVKDMASLIVGEEDQPGERDIEQAGGDGMKFFLLLQKHGNISPTNCDLLMELLKEIGRMDLVKIVQDQIVGDNTSNANQPSSPEVTSPTPVVATSTNNHQDQSLSQASPPFTDTSSRSPSSVAPGVSSRPSPDGSINLSQSSGSSPSPMTTTTTKEEGSSEHNLDETPKTSKVTSRKMHNNEPSGKSVSIKSQFQPNTSQEEILSPDELPPGNQDHLKQTEATPDISDRTVSQQQQLQPKVDSSKTPVTSNLKENAHEPLLSQSKNSTHITEIQANVDQSQGQAPTDIVQPSADRSLISSNDKKFFESLSSHPEQHNVPNTNETRLETRLENIFDESDPSTSDLGGTILTASSASFQEDSMQQNSKDGTSSTVPKGTQHMPSEPNQSLGNGIQSPDNLQRQMEDLSLDSPENQDPVSSGGTSNDIETDAPDESDNISMTEQKPDLNDGSNLSANQTVENSSPEDSVQATNELQKDQVEAIPENRQNKAPNLIQDRENGPSAPLLPSAAAAAATAATDEKSSSGDASSKKQSESSSKELRAYQNELATPPKSGSNYIICAPTGSGKTLTAAAICYHFYEQAIANKSYFKALFIVNIRHLTQQQRHAFRDRFPTGTVGTIGETERLKDVFFSETKYVVMVTAQIVVNAINSGDLSLQDISMIVFDECHHTTQNHPYNEIMKRYLKEKKIKVGLRRVIGESGGRLPHIIGLSASLGVGHGKDAYKHVLILCGNMDAKNVLQVLQNKEELGIHVNAPENDAIRYVSPRRAEQRDLSQIIEGIMDQIEGELWQRESILVEHGTQRYEQWIREEQKEAECSSDRAKTIASMYLFEYNRALLLFEDLRASDSLKHLEEFMHERDLEQDLVPIEELCRKLFEAELVEMKRICREENSSPNPKLEELANLLKEKFQSKPDSKGIILTRMRLATSALIEFIEKSPCLQGLRCPVTPVQLVGQGDTDNYFMTETEQKIALKKFKIDKECNLLVATDIAQEGLDMPACNFVIRFNFVSNEIGTVQSKGRARAPQSQCYLIVEEDSVNDKREMSNRQKVKDMQAAMDKLNALSEEKRLKEITETQEDIYKKLEDEEKSNQAAKKLEMPSESVEILCKECNSYITRGSYMRKKGCHFNCHDPDVKQRVTVVLYDKHTRYRDSETIGVFKCANPTCGQKLGIAVNFLKDGDFTQNGYGFSVKSFLFKFSENRKKTYKQWKKVPIDIPLDED